MTNHANLKSCGERKDANAEATEIGTLWERFFAAAWDLWPVIEERRRARAAAAKINVEEGEQSNAR